MPPLPPDVFERYLTTLQDPTITADERHRVLMEYADHLPLEPPTQLPLEPPTQLHEGRVVIKGVVGGSISSIETLVRDHLDMLLGSDAPLRINLLSGQIEQGARTFELGNLVTELRVAAERRVAVETQKPDPQTGQPLRVMLRIGADDTKAVVVKEASANAYSPVREWLEALQPCEPGAVQLAASEALGLSDALSCLLWRKWLIGAVARVMEPGCQMDTCLLLLAPGGGEGKSSMFRALTGGQWTSSTKLDIEGHRRQDGYMQLGAAWIYEIKEVGAKLTSEAREAWKSFLDERSDDYRAPYAAAVARHKRSVVFGASSNSLDIMRSDDTAFNRRFWPIRISGQIDTDMVELLRPQIWAEALAAYRAGEPWHLDRTQEAMIRLLAERHQDHADEDAWTPLVRAHLEAPARVDKALRLVDVARVALKIDAGKLSIPDQRRLGAVLRGLGYGAQRQRWRTGENPAIRWCTPSEGVRAPFDE